MAGPPSPRPLGRPGTEPREAIPVRRAGVPAQVTTLGLSAAQGGPGRRFPAEPQPRGRRSPHGRHLRTDRRERNRPPAAPLLV